MRVIVSDVTDAVMRVICRLFVFLLAAVGAEVVVIIRDVTGLSRLRGWGWGLLLLLSSLLLLLSSLLLLQGLHAVGPSRHCL
jgi:hypothetical protein